jgi:uncharacterized membrane protein YesL
MNINLFQKTIPRINVVFFTLVILANIIALGFILTSTKGEINLFSEVTIFHFAFIVFIFFSLLTFFENHSFKRDFKNSFKIDFLILFYIVCRNIALFLGMVPIFGGPFLGLFLFSLPVYIILIIIRYRIEKTTNNVSVN